ncbi:MAG: hypothetical protein ABSB25_03225 [Sedimentisphaerales bacterium]
MRQKTENRRHPPRPFGTGDISPKAEKTERLRQGSAIILAVVLTTLLAILGVLFLFSSRVDSVATSAVGDNHDLKLAVDTVVSQISQVLIHNVPGVDANGTYYNYPDGNNSWLACLEPYQYAPNIYHWRHITDINNTFWANSVLCDIPANIVREYQDSVDVGDSTPVKQFYADADGDGVSDSFWMQVQNVNSSKGKPVYAAIRIIDNGGMLNINTAYWFDVNADANRTDGSSQTQINLLALAQRPYENPATTTIQADADTLVKYRCGSGNAASYTNNVVWKYDQPVTPYTPFDISDELELRYRYLINQTGIDTRFEVMKGWEIGRISDFQTPIDTSTRFDEWKITASADGIFTDPSQYAYRHIATTYNMDRIIDPNGIKMLNINSPLDFNTNTIYNAVRAALPSVFTSADVAQITANLMDYIDGPNYPSTDPRYDPNNKVTVVKDSFGTPHFGFERPCVYISEIAQNFYKPIGNDPNYDKDDPNKVYRSYAIELFKPYPRDDDDPNGWKLSITNPAKVFDINWTGSKQFHVLANIDPKADIPIPPIGALDSDTQIDPDINFSPGPGSTIKLFRNVNGYGLVPVDLLAVPPPSINWMTETSTSEPHSYERDITVNRCIRRILNTSVTAPTLGMTNSFIAPAGTFMIQAHPANKQFTNIGEIGQLLYYDTVPIDQNSTEPNVRLNIADPCVQNLFKYLTVIDPCDHNPIDPNETRIKGRININTAPWFVLAQLPWVTNPDASLPYADRVELAQEIVNNRDTSGAGAFKSTGELMRVSGMSYYQGKAIPFAGLATPSPTDCNGDAFEERDVIFDRISNLVTVRSDVFTAYILVRIGPSGPQKRVIAILDRSDVRKNPNYPADPTPYIGKVKVIAIQQVPDAR